MLTEDNKKDFSEIFRGTAGVYGKEAQPTVMRMFFAALQKYDMNQIEAAFTSHVKTSKFMPTIADIIDKIESVNPAMQRPGADEAWAMIPKNEDDSVVWTEEMAEAYAVAAHLIHEGEKVGARMAFRDAYNRSVEQARMIGKPVHWFLSRGHNRFNMEDVVKEAMRLGRLPQNTGNALLLEAGHKAPINPANLLAGPKGEGVNAEKAKEALGKLKAMLEGMKHGS